MALDPIVKARIEHDLRRYRQWRARLTEIEYQLIDSFYEGSNRNQDTANVQKSGTSDPTFQIVCQRIKLEAERANLKRRIERMDNALSAMNREQKELVLKLYVDGLDRRKIELEMNIEKSTFYRIKEKALIFYGEVAGHVPSQYGI
ncbi:DUF1492 domain-containing protein [Thermoactinomyces sp. DSM 45892]|uniref:DUF1492 domain-containing protein n=1 Tax=Thermoactinomyces sp. DSM 45892 TaxID=1882753 RepID=UPI00089477BC|nr:DUF1492 domain-containing protein [Thermoactinomyces sp. DSM 45892]SDZ00375.1 hypothetical protein SAMN05444416_11192 [Thermoactinomyces sp. DSM 45892]